MIIPMKPENVRITIQLTSADIEAGEFTHDIDLQKLYNNRNSCAYEFALDYNGQQISNDYKLSIDDGTLYATVFFTSNDGSTVKMTLSAGEGTISASSPELPSVSGSDNGKVLTVVEGAWGAADPVSELPAVTSSDEGDVLTVNGSGEWVNAEPSSQLPAVSGADDGKVLTVSSGEWSAQNLGQNIFTYDFTVENPFQLQGLGSANIGLEYIYDEDRNIHTFPNTRPSGFRYFLNSFNCGDSGIIIAAIYPPYYDASIHEWSPPSIVIENLDNTTKSIEPIVTMSFLGMELPLFENN